MKLKQLKTLFIAGLVALSSLGVSASVITPVGVWASSAFGIYDENNLINDSGLSGLLHDTDERHMWLSKQKDVQSTLTFDLGAVYNLNGAYIWQYNPSAGGSFSGVQHFNILTSLDNVLFNAITTASLSRATGDSSTEVQFRSFTQAAKYVKFSVLDNYGENYTGLSEVKFEEGGAATVLNEEAPVLSTGLAVPEPSTASLLGLSILGFFMLRGMSKFYTHKLF